MNASTPVAAAAIVLFALAASPASAMMSSAKSVAPTVAPMIVQADFVQGHEAVAGIPARQAAARVQSSAMTARYFDVDMFVTLGALALASGAFVAVGMAGSRRRPSTASVAGAREGWRDEVMQALELDLAQFTRELRRAA